MSPAKQITLAECQEHMSDKDCWLVIDGKVYDVTPFLDEHPGGFDTLVSNSGAPAPAQPAGHGLGVRCSPGGRPMARAGSRPFAPRSPRRPAGKDSTEEFEEIGHSRAAKEMLGKYYIGEFAVSGAGAGGRRLRAGAPSIAATLLLAC